MLAHIQSETKFCSCQGIPTKIIQLFVIVHYINGINPEKATEVCSPFLYTHPIMRAFSSSTILVSFNAQTCNIINICYPMWAWWPVLSVISFTILYINGTIVLKDWYFYVAKARQGLKIVLLWVEEGLWLANNITSIILKRVILMTFKMFVPSIWNFKVPSWQLWKRITNLDHTKYK